MNRTKTFLKYFTIASVLIWFFLLYMLNDRIRSQTLLEVDPKMTSEGEVVLRDEWLGLYMDSSPVGYTNIKLARTLRARQFEIQTESSLSVNIGGVRRKIETYTIATVNDEIDVRSFKFQMFSELARFHVTGVVNADSVRCTLTAADSQTHKTFSKDEFPVPNGTLCLGETLRFYILQNQLVSGETVRVNLLDVATLSIGEATVKRGEEEEIEVLGQKVLATPYYQTLGALTSTVWLDDEGEVLKESSNMGGLSLVSHRQEKRDLLAFAGERTGPDILARSRISVRTVIERPREVARMKLRISPVNLEDFSNHGFHMLKEEGETITLETNSSPREEELQPAAKRPYLVETESMPLQNDKIQKALGRLIKQPDSDMTKATRIAEWIHKSMTPQPVLSFPNAAEVISTLKGDCNEHAALFGAMGRAAGIPTKICAGLMLLDNHFYYHAWNEIYIDGKWYTVDTTLPQEGNTLPTVDAAHLKFVEGELSEQIPLLGLIGTLKIEILEWETFAEEGV